MRRKLSPWPGSCAKEKQVLLDHRRENAARRGRPQTSAARNRQAAGLGEAREFKRQTEVGMPSDRGSPSVRRVRRDCNRRPGQGRNRQSARLCPWTFRDVAR